MKCLTVNIFPTGIEVQRGMKRRVRNSPAGPITWLGYPWTARTDKGFANLGRHCDVIHLNGLVYPKTTKLGTEADVTIEECEIGGRKPLQLVHSAKANDSVLVLLRVSTHEQHAQVPDTELAVAEGYFVERGQVVPSRHPNCYVKQSVEERLVVLGQGESVQVQLFDKPARVYGAKIHGGQCTTLSIRQDGQGSVEVTEKSKRPLQVPSFNPMHLLTDLIGLVIVVAFCAMCGFLTGENRDMMRVSAFYGGLVGVALFQLLAVFRMVRGFKFSPEYTSLKPVSYKEEP